MHGVVFHHVNHIVEVDERIVDANDLKGLRPATAARKTKRPMRPKPLMPTLIDIELVPPEFYSGLSCYYFIAFETIIQEFVINLTYIFKYFLENTSPLSLYRANHPLNVIWQLASRK